jgi:N-sulfoglucosamine sulfohydrolase
MNKAKWIIASLFFPFIAGTSLAQTEGSETRPAPNILFIVSEDNGPDLGCYGAPVKTPNLDRIASEGTRFERAFVTQAGCSQSRASFFTGTYPHQNGQIGLATWDYSMYREDTPNFVNDLKKAGFRTGNIGKIHVNPESAFDFDWWEIKGGNFKRKNLDTYAEAAFDFISASDDPFYLQVNYPDAHTPFLPQVDGHPKKVITADMVEPLAYIGLSNHDLKQRTADYYNCMVRLDEYVGELLEKLKESGKYDNTLIVYIGDHGADIIRGKRTCLEGGTMIPMIISWPGKGEKGFVYNGLVSTIDLYPTFMEVAGQNIPDHLKGKSLVNVLKGDSNPVREYLFTEYHVHSNHNPFPQRAVRNDRYKLIHNLVAEYENPGYYFTLHKKVDSLELETALSDAPKILSAAYERMKHSPEYELYDLKKDPYEWINLAGKRKYKKIQDDLVSALHIWQAETDDPMRNKELAEKLFLEIMAAEGEKIEIRYHDYLDPNLKKEY